LYIARGNETLKSHRRHRKVELWNSLSVIWG